MKKLRKFRAVLSAVDEADEPAAAEVLSTVDENLSESAPDVRKAHYLEPSALCELIKPSDAQMALCSLYANRSAQCMRLRSCWPVQLAWVSLLSCAQQYLQCIVWAYMCTYGPLAMLSWQGNMNGHVLLSWATGGTQCGPCRGSAGGWA